MGSVMCSVWSPFRYYNLGALYMGGVGVRADAAKAAQYFQVRAFVHQCPRRLVILRRLTNFLTSCSFPNILLNKS